jgi:hypothetical protein
MEMKRVFCWAAMMTTLVVAFGAVTSQHGLVHGLLVKNAHTVFPIGIYEMPKTDAELQTMAKAGINLVRCSNKGDLDRAKGAGMMGWVPVPMQSEDPGKVRELVESVKDHPALAVWEGPDELVWNFTAGSNLYREGIHKVHGEWWLQTPEAVEYSEAQARKIIPRLIENIRLVRSLDGGRHPIWINEAGGSDMKFIRQYVEHIDITGCDVYPIHNGKRRPSILDYYTERFLSIGEDRPVWMVLQGFAWGDLQRPGSTEKPAFPSFAETRLSAYTALAHRAGGILYWGSFFIPADRGADFRDSIYAMTSELAKLQPFLTVPEQKSVHILLTESEEVPPVGDKGVRWMARAASSDWLLVLVNEDDHPHMGVEVKGLEALNGRQLQLLYGTENATIQEGEFITRMMPREVKVFATSRKWESTWPTGREYPGT